MNPNHDGATPTSSAARHPTTVHENTSDRAHDSDSTQHQDHTLESAPETEELAEGSSARRLATRKAGLARKLKFLSHLMKSLDNIFMAEVCALYYME